MKVSTCVLLFLYIQIVMGQDDCHCLNKTRCPDNCDSQCDPGWSGPSCHKVNIARGQITIFNGTELNVTSAQVTDGNTADSNCASISGFSLSWQIQFEEPRIITSMKIFWSESDIPTGNIVVTVGEISCFSQNTSIREVQITCDTPTEGNHVIIRNMYSGAGTSLSFTICEVEIYECVDGFYGTNCSNRCDCGESELCDKRNGDCVQQVSPSTSVATTVNVSASEASVATTDMSASTSDTPFTHSTTSVITDTTAGIASSTEMTPSVTTDIGTTQNEETTDATPSNVTSESPSSTDTTTMNVSSSEISLSTTETSSTASSTSSITFETTSNMTDASEMAPGPVISGPLDWNIVASAIGVGVLLLLIIIVIIISCRRNKGHEEVTPENGHREETNHNSFNRNTDSTLETGLHEHMEEEPVIPAPTEPGSSNDVMKDEHTASNVVIVPEKNTFLQMEPRVPLKNETDTDELPDDPDEEPMLEDDMDPYYNHIPNAIPVTSLRDYVQERLDGVGFENEFMFLPSGLRSSYETGKTTENNPKNRYKHIYAYDHSRVVLERDEQEMDDAETDYINASYIHGYKTPKRFIATQGPIPLTVADFWLMVWQQKTEHIIMLANTYENERKKCEKYWPSEGEADNYGIINVCLEKTKEYADYTVRMLTLHHLGEDTKREVTQYHFTTWPDHGVPTTASLVKFWRLFRRQEETFAKKCGPVVVHCSAGIGRTGTFIGLDYLVEEAEGEGKVNIFTAVLVMRDDRINMVQTKIQYSFLHLALLEVLHSKNTLTMASDLSVKLEEENVEIQDEYQNMDIMASLQIPEEKKKDRRKKNENDTQDDTSSTLKLTPWPSYFNKKGFLHVDTFEDDLAEEFWNLIYRRKAATVITFDEELSTVMSTTEGTPTRVGAFDLTVTSKEDATHGITEMKLTLNCTSDESQAYKNYSAKRNVVIYHLKTTSEEPHFDRPSLIYLIEILNDRQQTGDHHPVVLRCGDGTNKCALFAAAANVISCLRLNQEVDIYLTVREIQCHKGQPVTCLEDYRFLYELANDYVQMDCSTDTM